MSFTLSEEPNTGRLRLSGGLEIYQAEAIRQALLERLTQRAEVVLDLALVDGCDAAGAQLLWAARQAATQSGKSFRCENPSEPILACWRGLGLEPTFFPRPAAGDAMALATR